jgi:hypothetical protein
MTDIFISYARSNATQAHCAKLGPCDYGINTGHWRDWADPGALPYDFKAECRQVAGT